MAKRMVIRVSNMHSDKTRSKALKIVVGVKGVESAALGKKDKNELEVTGGVDPVQIVYSLRKKLPKWPKLFICMLPEKMMASAELISVSDEKKKDEKKDEDEAKRIIWPYGYPYTFPQYVCQEDPYNRCSIL